MYVLCLKIYLSQKGLEKLSYNKNIPRFRLHSINFVVILYL